MNRLTVIAVWMAVIMGAAFMLYRVKYEVQALRTQISETNRELAQEKEAMHVVAAEWAYLNRPERLQQLVDKYLVSSNLTVAQVAVAEAIPFPKQMEAANDMDDEIHDDMRPTTVAYHKGATAP